MMNKVMNIEKIIICPISHQIFLNPVNAPDGFTYEHNEIITWLEKNGTSPMTREKMEIYKLSPNNLVKDLVNVYLNEYPDNKMNQYRKIHLNNIDEVKQLISNNKFEKLLDIVEYDISQMFGNNLFVNLLENCKDFSILKHVLDNCIDLECVSSKKWMPIHYLCRYSTPEIIKYIIDKNVDLEYATNDGWKPIHLICRYSTSEMIKYIIDKNVDLECATNNGWKPIHFICHYSTPKIIKYIISKNVDLESTTSYGWKPIHYICKYSTPEIIKYVIDKNVDLEYMTNDKWTPIYLVCRYSTIEMIKYIMDKGIKLSKEKIVHCEDKFDHGKNNNKNCFELIQLNGNINFEEIINYYITNIGS